MTDIEILEIIENCELDEIVPPYNFSIIDKDKFLSAMREAMKLESIGFANYAKDFAYELDTKKWYGDLEIINLENGKTTEHLYNEYLNQSK